MSTADKFHTCFDCKLTHFLSLLHDDVNLLLHADTFSKIFIRSFVKRFILSHVNNKMRRKNFLDASPLVKYSQYMYLLNEKTWKSLPVTPDMKKLYEIVAYFFAQLNFTTRLGNLKCFLIGLMPFVYHEASLLLILVRYFRKDMQYKSVIRRRANQLS